MSQRGSSDEVHKPNEGPHIECGSRGGRVSSFMSMYKLKGYTATTEMHSTNAVSLHSGIPDTSVNYSSLFNL